MTPPPEKLSNYKKKRDFRKTGEPSEGGSPGDWADKRPVFVIQKHDASTLHYDFRIEVNGVLKSWVVPKGPSTDPDEKRLAIPTEDHPLEYADFEGTILEDAYGGTVLIWDRGSFANLKEEEDDAAESVSEQIDNGHVTIRLQGKKISGGYALVRTGQENDARWLLIKMDDDQADARRNPTSTEPKSVKSGMDLEEIRKAIKKESGKD